MLSKRARHTILSVLGACIVVYFIYHTIQGDRGWVSMLRLQHEVEQAEQTLTKLQDEHQRLDHHERMMRSNSIDPDLLEEQARKNLNYSKPNEIIILTPSTKKDDAPAP